MGSLGGIGMLYAYVVTIITIETKDSCRTWIILKGIEEQVATVFDVDYWCGAYGR